MAWPVNSRRAGFREDGVVGQRQKFGQDFAGAEIGVEDGRHAFLAGTGEHRAQALKPADVA